MSTNYKLPIDTLVMKGKVRLLNYGGTLFNRTTANMIKDVSKMSFTHPIKHTQYIHQEDEVPELVRTQDYYGRISIHTHKHFTSEYGYSMYMSIPSRVYYAMSSGRRITQKQQDAISSTPMYLEIKIPSVSGMLGMPAWEDWIITKYKGESGKLDDMIWDYISYHHSFSKYGIEEYEQNKTLDKTSLPITQIDYARNINGRLVKDILELVSMTGYYARKNMRVWHNTSTADIEGDVIYQSPNGIEFRKGKKSSEIYKFYDKDIQKGQQYYDAVYSSKDFGVKSVADRLLRHTRKEPTTCLRYEVSIRKVPSTRNAVNKIYSRTTGEYKDITLFDVLENPIYNRVPNKIMSDGLYNIFGKEIEKDITDLLAGDKTMSDTDILQEYGSKGLKFLGIKYFLDKGMNNDELWPYLVKKGGLNYEVMRRIRNEMRDEGVVNKWNDSHTRTLDTLRGVYRDMKQ
tara:strand:+ start:2159 stop:3532 length:1374 start_codon:yes stop_codon:yes gene_type:complete